MPVCGRWAWVRWWRRRNGKDPDPDPYLWLMDPDWYSICHTCSLSAVYGRWACGALCWVRRWRRRRGKDPDPDPYLWLTDPDWYSIHHTCSLSVYNCVRQVSVRRALLGQKMEEESGQFLQERGERIRYYRKLVFIKKRYAKMIAALLLNFGNVLLLLARSHPQWMRSSQVARASGCQCQSRNSPGFDPSTLRHTEGRQMKYCWITFIKRKTKNPPLLFLQNILRYRGNFCWYKKVWIFGKAFTKKAKNT